MNRTAIAVDAAAALAARPAASAPPTDRTPPVAPAPPARRDVALSRRALLRLGSAALLPALGGA